MTNPHADGKLLQAGAPLEGTRLVVVLLHGRGGSAEDVLGLAGAFDLTGITYLAPEAHGRTWYPCSFMAPREANEPYLSSALGRIEAVVEAAEQAGTERARIVIAGFSQGACLATEYVATRPARYGGLIAWTGGLIGPVNSVEAGRYAGTGLTGMPAFFGSGDPDPHVPWSRVEESAKVLRAMGASVTTKRYPGRLHTVSANEILMARALLLASARETFSSGGKEDSGQL